MIKKLFAVVALGVVAASAGPAQALNSRTWISGTGVDQAGCGPIANPCRTLQYAHDNTSAGGEIDVKDSAGYGSVVITKAISIVGDGSLAGVLAPAAGTAITINAGPNDLVSLHGLTIDGGGVGYNGVLFFSGGKLEVADCVVKNFKFNASYLTGNGISVLPTSGTVTVTVANVTASNNGRMGVEYLQTGGATASATIAFDRIRATNNNYGIAIEGGNSPGFTRAAITNSLVAHSLNDGVYISGGTVSMDLTTVEENGASGINVFSGTLNIGRSLSVNNAAYGLTHYGTILSYKDNRFAGNVSGPIANPSNPADLTLGTAPLY